MEYVLTFEDGFSGYLAHHGVKGMKWGVWNAETRDKYTLKKGSQIRRYTSVNEVKRGTDLSKRFYAAQNQHDFDLYGKSIDNLPSTSLRYKKAPIKKLLTAGLYDKKLANKKIGIVTYEAIDDVKVAKGKQVLNRIMSEYGNTEIKNVLDDKGYGYVRAELKLPENLTYNNMYADKTIKESTKKAAARFLVADVLGATEDSRWYATKDGKYKEIKGPGKKLIDELKKEGYDAVEDIEDQLSTVKEFNVQSPLIVLNGNKFRVADTRIINRNKIPKS